MPAVVSDYYALLEIARDADAESVKAAILRQRRRASQMQNVSSREKRREAEDRMAAISQAEATLLDPVKRAAYDRNLDEAEAAAGRESEPEPDQDTDGLDPWIVRAVEYLRARRYRQAYGAACQATNRSDAPAAAWSLRGRAALALGNAQDAVFAFGEAIGLQTEDDQNHYFLGLAHQSLRDYEDAVSAFITAMRLDPQDRRYPAAVAAVLIETGTDDAAVEFLGPIQAADPDDEDCNVLLALALRNQVAKLWTALGDNVYTVTNQDQITRSRRMVRRALTLRFGDQGLRSDLERAWLVLVAAEKKKFRLPGAEWGCVAPILYLIALSMVGSLIGTQALVGLAVAALAVMGWYRLAVRPAWARNAKDPEKDVKLAWSPRERPAVR
jgi:tetratricopeptide (TPR) repeat protein